MSALKSQDKDGVRIVNFVADKLLDEAVIQQVGEELVAIATNAAEGEKIVLSFRGVSFMSSAMLGRLIMFHKKSKKANVELKVCSISPELFEVFKITKLDKMFDVQKDEQQALASFNKKGWFG